MKQLLLIQPTLPFLFFKKTLFATLIILTSALHSAPAYTQQQTAELVLVGGNIYTVDQARPRAEAIAMDA
ncbi:MAG: hypothetical protein ACPIA2_16515, partial [Mariniblastus sp.]